MEHKINQTREYTDSYADSVTKWVSAIYTEVQEKLQTVEMLERRLDALERAHWHDGIENNCTECKEVWGK